ncbi:uncharacterized protein [Amphiura filiformis]|uniref:uncharacterized protein n=1 Tax=Amphiura filiformis TaxID=82378 RepID=UPI003B219782
MDAFRRLKKKVVEKQETPYTPQDQTGQTNIPQGQEASGFICPMCMVNLPSPEALQSHYVNIHDTAQSTSAHSVEAVQATPAPAAASVSSEVRNTCRVFCLEVINEHH